METIFLILINIFVFAFIFTIIYLINKTGVSCKSSEFRLPNGGCGKCKTCKDGYKKLMECTIDSDTVCSDCSNTQYKKEDGTCQDCLKCGDEQCISEPCTSNTDNKCISIKPDDDFFKNQDGMCQKCLSCGDYRLDTPCNLTTDTICSPCLKTEFMDSEENCQSCKQCENDIKIKCTANEDTVCNECPTGQFANESSVCQDCLTCNEPEFVKIACSPMSNTICATGTCNAQPPNMACVGGGGDCINQTNPSDCYQVGNGSCCEWNFN